MDRIKNPFSPDGGASPPEMVGRDEPLEEARVLFKRVLQGRSEKSLLMIGLRGVGKTVLMNEVECLAQSCDYRAIFFEASEDTAFEVQVVRRLPFLLYDLSPSVKVFWALMALKSFIITAKIPGIELGLDIEPSIGIADSGDLEMDLSDLFVAVAEAVAEQQRGVAILIDELQCCDTKALKALIMAVHKIQQKSLPLVLLGAGLPMLPRLVGNAKPYAERMFNFQRIGALDKPDAIRALQVPVEKHQVAFTEEALDEIFRVTEGYPYFLQEWGYQAWNQAEDRQIDLSIVQRVSEKVVASLDENFFRVHMDRLTPAGKVLLRAMAGLGPGKQRTSDVAAAMSLPIGRLGPIRASLVKKGMLYSPEHGYLAFTAPLFGEFLLRDIPARS